MTNDLVPTTLQAFLKEPALDKIKALAPEGMPSNFAQKFMTAFFIYLANDEAKAKDKAKALKTCSSLSLWRCLTETAALGLIPSPNLGHVYFINYGQEATLQIGYKGIIQLLLRDSSISFISGNIAYEGEHYKRIEGTHPSIEHTPDPSKRGTLYEAYAIIKFKNGDVLHQALTKAEIEKHRACAKSQKFWGSWYEEMALKTVIKKLSKFIKSSSLYETLIEIEAKETYPKEKLEGQTYENSAEFLEEKLSEEE